MTEHTALCDEFRGAIERLCERAERWRAGQLAAIAFVAPDDLFSVGACLRFDRALPPEAGPYAQLSPVEWGVSDESSCESLNRYLVATRPSVDETEREYRGRVRRTFDACASAFEELDLRRRYGPDLYVTFAGVDPNPTLVEEEGRFVRRLNPVEVYDLWCSTVA